MHVSSIEPLQANGSSGHTDHYTLQCNVRFRNKDYCLSVCGYSVFFSFKIKFTISKTDTAKQNILHGYLNLHLKNDSKIKHDSKYKPLQMT
uniref:Uncharacterized protein n=1 Tax=Anguilla anguilla TaxID=7936 RepID=A0A0E9WVZ6_ANGAN